MLQVRAALPGDCKYSQQRQRQEPGDLSSQRFVEEPQWAGSARAKGPTQATTALWRLLCRALLRRLYRTSILIRPGDSCVRPASKAKLSNETANAIVAKGKADLRVVLAGADVRTQRSRCQIYRQRPRERYGEKQHSRYCQVANALPYAPGCREQVEQPEGRHDQVG